MTPSLLTSTAAPVSSPATLVDADDGLREFARETCEAVCGVGRLAAATLAVCPAAADAIEIVAAHGEATDELRAALLTPAGARIVLRAAEHGGFAEDADERLVVAAAPAGSLRLVLVGRRDETAVGWDACLAQLMEGTARIAGLALRDRLRLAEDECRRAERERTELACTIHEDVVQRMFGVSLALDDEGPLDAGLREMCAAELECALSDLRSIIRRSPQDGPLRRAGLDEALAQLADEGVEVDASCNILTATAAQQAIARSVVTEAVCNARKHAPAGRIQVTVHEADGLLKLSVINDGVPGVRRSPSRSGVGLSLAATETAQGGGVLEHGPMGHGRWAVRLALPLEERDEHDCHGVARRGTDG